MPRGLPPRHRRRRKSGARAAILGFGIASAVVLAGLGIWRGGFFESVHAGWNAFARELEERGEPVYPDGIVPPALDDNANFFADPVFAPLTGSARADETGGLIEQIRSSDAPVQVSDLLAVEQESGGASLESIAKIMVDAGLVDPSTDYVSVGDVVLAGMRAMALDFSPLERAGRREGSRFPVDYSNPGDPPDHLPVLEILGDWLAIRAVALLATGNSAAAAADTLLVLRLADSISAEPRLASQRTRRKLLGVATGCIRAGIESGSWTADQLQEFVRQLAPARPLMDFAWGLRGERAVVNHAIRDLVNSGNPPDSLLNDPIGTDAKSISARAIRSRQLAINRAIQEWLDVLGDGRQLYPALLETAPDIAADLSPEAVDYLARLARDARAFTRMQSAIAQTRTACALEQFRLQQASLPESLEDLVPKWLPAIPIDPISGAPVTFATTPDGYILPARGWTDTTEWDWQRNWE